MASTPAPASRGQEHSDYGDAKLGEEVHTHVENAGYDTTGEEEGYGKLNKETILACLVSLTLNLPHSKIRN